MADALQRTPLHDRHVAAGARLVPFAGWEMPVQYEGIRAEHEAVRGRAGVFDVSHMGEIETSGPDAEAFLQRVLSNDVTKLKDGGAQYSVLCRDDGGVLDDLFSYRLGDRFLTVTNASNHESDLAWFQQQADAIPLGSRIVAVCDAYDAMTSGRPYAAARTPHEALDELRRCAGTQFDPAVVETFRAVVAESTLRSAA